MSPRSPGPCTVSRLVRLLRGRAVVAVTGAGCSTESGIPDYRGPRTRHDDRSPLRYGRFVRDSEARARYWARSAVGWRRVADARPNDGHRALARLERHGVLRGVVTQNVDGLHQAAGSRRVVELHGSLSRVRCLECDAEEARASVQRRIVALNPGWTRRPARAAADGDAELADAESGSFRVPACRRCGGVLKPDVVFFGEDVPRQRVRRAWELVEEAEAVLVAGSSLRVWSGLRFVEGAAREGAAVAIVNLGRTRADDLAAARVHAATGRALPRVADRLLEVAPGPGGARSGGGERPPAPGGSAAGRRGGGEEQRAVAWGGG